MTAVNAAAEAGDKFIDLDAALEERRAASEPLVVRLFSRDWELPGTAPAIAFVTLSRWSEAGLVDADGNVSDDVDSVELLSLLADMIPEKVFKAWCAEGLDVEEVEPVVTMVLGKYQDLLEARTAARAEGKAAAPKKGRSGQSKSSNGGATSKRTSNGSTGSRSRRR